MNIQSDCAPSIHELLVPYKEKLAAAFEGYLHHCIRVSSFCMALSPEAADPKKIYIASAFHDLGIWTDNTFDYLKPSAELAKSYLITIGKESWIEEVVSMISNHHKLTPFTKNPMWLTEAFRKADLIDVSLGKIKFDLPSSLIQDVLQKFPNAGFHRQLLSLATRRMRSNPFSPLPMLKW